MIFYLGMGLMPKVVIKHLTNLKALSNAADIDGVHDNQRAASLIVENKIEDRDKTVEIYLAEAELQALYEVPLIGKNDYIFNDNLIALFENYNYNVQKANEQVLNRYIKNFLKDLSETVPSLKEKVPTKLTMKQKEAMRRDKIEPETDLNGNVIVPRYDCVTSHTARRTGITNMYLSHKCTILQKMHVSGHKTPKTFMDYIKLSPEEIADEIASMSKKESDMW